MSVFGTVVVNLVHRRCWCGTPFAVPEEMDEKQTRDHNNGVPQTSIYCPHGHTLVYAGEGEAARLRKQLVQEQSRANTLKARLTEEEAARVKAEKAAKRLKTRAAHGVCPCCKRTVKQLAEHMKVKHPDYVKANA